MRLVHAWLGRVETLALAMRQWLPASFPFHHPDIQEWKPIMNTLEVRVPYRRVYAEVVPMVGRKITLPKIIKKLPEMPEDLIIQAYDAIKMEQYDYDGMYEL